MMKRQKGALLLFFILCRPAAAREAENSTESEVQQAADDGQPEILSIEKCLELARKNHPAVMAARHKLVSLKKQLDEAHWTPFFNIGMTTLLAPTPTMRGHAVESETGEWGDYSQLGVWVRLQVQAGFPVFTFGKIRSFWEMAEEGVNIGKMELEKQVNEIEYEVRRAYFTVQFARQIKSVLDEGRDYLEEAREKIENDLETEAGEATLTDLLKVKAYTAQMDSQVIQIQNVEKLAISGLEFLTGRASIDVQESFIKSEEGSLKKLPFYMEEARKNRPELFILDSAVNVSRANLKLARSHYLPDFVLVGNYTFAYANKVDNQDTPFAYDPYNTNGGGVALMMNYPFDFVPNYYRMDKAKANLHHIQAQQQAATGAFLMEVEKAYNEALSLEKRVSTLKKGKKAAKGWIVATHQNYQAGLAELKDFTDALVTYFTLTTDYYKTIFEYNLALGSLRLATGSSKLF